MILHIYIPFCYRCAGCPVGLPDPPQWLTKPLSQQRHKQVQAGQHFKQAGQQQRRERQHQLSRTGRHTLKQLQRIDRPTSRQVRRLPRQVRLPPRPSGRPTPRQVRWTPRTTDRPTLRQVRRPPRPRGRPSARQVRRLHQLKQPYLQSPASTSHSPSLTEVRHDTLWTDRWPPTA